MIGIHPSHRAICTAHLDSSVPNIVILPMGCPRLGIEIRIDTGIRVGDQQIG